MKVYKFKCKECGSREYEKLNDNTYKCAYCGSTEEVFLPETESKKHKKIEIVFKQGESGAQTQGDEQEVHTINVGSPVLMFFLTLFFGTFGVHRMIKGKIFSGVVFLLTYGLFGIGYFIDLVGAFFNMFKSREM